MAALFPGRLGAHASSQVYARPLSHHQAFYTGGRMTYVSMEKAYIIITIIVAFGIGAKFPDIDLAPVFPLRHRSAWTHGALIPYLLWWGSSLHPLAWWAAFGFLPSYAGHLLADCLPRSWQGSALVKLYPLPVSLNWFFSFTWIALGAFAAIGVWLVYFLWRLI